MLKDQTYEHVKSQNWTEEIVKEVRRRLTVEGKARDINIERYKLIVTAVIGEVKGQGIKVASKCLWDVANDNYATYTYQNESLFCTCMVFGIYYE